MSPPPSRTVSLIPSHFKRNKASHTHSLLGLFHPSFLLITLKISQKLPFPDERLVGLPVVARFVLRCDVTEAIKGFFVAVTVDKSTQRKDLCVFSVLLHPATSSKLQLFKPELQLNYTPPG